MSAHTHALALLAAYRDCHPMDAALDSGPMDSAEAYAVQQTVWRALAGNTRPTAWKVAATALGEIPIAAPILPQRLLAGSLNTPATLPANTLVRPGIEAEIAVRFNQDLPQRPEPYRMAEIHTAIADLCIAMEVIDTRLADPEAAGPNWRLADSLLNGALVLGTPIPNWQDLDFNAMTVRVREGNQILADRIGKQPLGDLFHCLPWLIEHAGGLRAGDVVTTGAWTGMHPVAGWGTLPTKSVIEFVGLGTASITSTQT